METLDISYNAAFTFAFYVIIFRSLWYEVARFTNYCLSKVLDEDIKNKSKNKQVKTEKTALQNFFFKDISHFPYAKQASSTATFITIMSIMVLFSYFLYVEFSEAIIDPFLKCLYPVIVFILYSFIFGILFVRDILLIFINEILILKNKKSTSSKYLYELI